MVKKNKRYYKKLQKKKYKMLNKIKKSDKYDVVEAKNVFKIDKKECDNVVFNKSAWNIDER